MIAGMGGGETGTLRAITCQHPDRLRHQWFIAWAQAYDRVLDKRTAYKIADDAGHDEPERPQPSLFAEIKHTENKQE